MSRSLKKSLGRGPLREGTPKKEGHQTRVKNDVPKVQREPVSKSLTDSVWDDDGNSSTPPLEKDNPTHTLRLKSRTCNYIVNHRGKKRLCWRECYKNNNVCAEAFHANNVPLRRRGKVSGIVVSVRLKRNTVFIIVKAIGINVKVSQLIAI